MTVKNRKLNRLENWDYSTPWWYFVTICAKDKKDWFGEIVKNCWLDIPKHFSDVELDEFVIMPNHVHGILIINYLKNNNFSTVGNNDRCSLQINKPNRNMEMLPKIISQYKSSVTRLIWVQLNQKQYSWQKSYYDHIIRNEKSLEKIREYIRDNPLRWECDKNGEEEVEY